MTRAHDERLSRAAVLTVLVVALLVRAGFTASVASSEGPAATMLSVLLGDEVGYDLWARAVAEDRASRDRAFYQEPAYAWTLGQLYRAWPPVAVGDDPIAIARSPVHEFVIALQHLMGAATAVLVAGLGTRALGRRVGWIAGLAAAVSGPLVFHETMLLKTSLSLLLTTITLHVWLDVWRGAGRARELGLGALLGVGILLRGNLYLLLALVLLSLVATAPRRWRSAFAVAAAALLVLSPATIHNVRRGDLVLSTYQAGTNAAIGQPPSPDPRRGLFYEPLRAGRGSVEYEEVDAIELAEQAAGRSLSSAEISQFWWSRVRAAVAAHPRAAVQRVAIKVASTFHPDEVPDVKDWRFVRRAVPWLATPLSDLTLFGPLAAVGFVLLPWRRRPLLVVRGAVLVTAVTLGLFYVMARYRITAAPALWVLAAGAIDRAHLALLDRARPWWRRALPATACVLVLAAGRIPLRPDADDHHLSLANLSSTERFLAETAEDAANSRTHSLRAVAAAREAVETAPGFTAARRQLVLSLDALAREEPGSAASRAHRENATLETWRLLAVLEALRLGRPETDGLGRPLAETRGRVLATLDQPGPVGGTAYTQPLTVFALRRAAEVLREPGEVPLALRLLDRAIALDPDDGELRVQRGLALKRAGRLADAEAEYRAAFARGVDSVELHNNLGNLLMDLERPAEALASFERAASLAPGHPVVVRNVARAREALADR